MGSQMTARHRNSTTTDFGNHRVRTSGTPGSVTPPTIKARNHGAAAPPGAFRINRATPCQTNSMASVTTMSGTRVTTISAPLIAPMATPTPRTASTIRPDCPPLAPSISTAPVTLATDIMAAMDRSIPPAITTIAMPRVASANGKADRARLSKPVSP